jgi:hypothetical protein
MQMQVELQQLDLRYGALMARDRRGEARAVAAASQAVEGPAIVVVVEGARLVVVEGFERVRALERLGHDKTEATSWGLTAPEALALRERLRQGRLSALEEGWLIEELVGSEGWREDEIARQFSRSVSWVKRRREIVSVLPRSVQARVKRGELSALVASGPLYTLARQSKRTCERLTEAISGKALTRRQVRRLVTALLRGGAESRERVLFDPELYLKADAAAEKAGGAVVRKARALLGIARRIERELLELPRKARDEVKELIDETVAVLSRVVKEDGEDAGTKDTSDDPSAEGEGARDAGDRQGAFALTRSGQEGDRPGERGAGAAVATLEPSGPFTGDPGADGALPGQPRQGPRGALDDGSFDLVSGADGLRQEPQTDGEDPGGALPLRAWQRDSARHLTP